MSFRMGGRGNKMFLMVFVFICILPIQLVNGQDYTWDGAAGAGVPETFYRFGPRYDMIMETHPLENTIDMEIPTVFPFFGVDQTVVSVSTEIGFLMLIITH